jgi:hypothetical protein
MHNNDLIKTPNKNDIMSAYEISELAKCVGDPKYFIKEYCYLQHPTKGKMKFQLFEYQERLIDVYHGYRNNISMLPRQSGKSQCAAAYLLWYAMFNPDLQNPEKIQKFLFGDLVKELFHY